MVLSGESKTVEYKQEYSKTLLKTVCAFANFHDGSIVIGVKNDGSIVGIEDIDELKLNIEHAINDTLIPKPYYEFEGINIEEDQILVIKVYKGDHTPYTYQGKSYVRRDTSTIQTDTIMNQNLILAGRNLGYEDLTASTQNLSFIYFENMMKRHFQITSLSNDLLKTLGLLGENGFNNAAALLSDENPVESSVVHLIAFNDIGVSRIKDKVTLQSCSVLNQFDACMSFYKKHINVGEIIETAYRRTIEDVPLIAFREAVANMLIHRDYSAESASRIEFYSDRIEIVSPGGLPLGLLREEYIEGKLSKARNRILSDVFLRLKIIEKLATGIRRIKEQYIDQDEKPKFLVSENAVVVVLPYVMEVRKRDYNSKLVRDKSTLYGNEKLIYDLILQNPGLKRASIQDKIDLEKSQTIEVLNKLRESGLIIKIGNGPATSYKVLE